MFVRTQENYREVFKSILGLKPDLRIFLFTLFNTGGRDLPGAREIFLQEQHLTDATNEGGYF